MSQGMTKEQIAQTIDVHVDRVAQSIDSLIGKGLLTKRGDRYFFTDKGQQVSDTIFEQKGSC